MEHLGINQLILFELEEDIFGIDIMKTEEVIRSKELRIIPNSPYYFEGMLNLRGEIIPIINVKKLFEFTYFDLSQEKAIIIIKLEGKKFGIIIDKVLRVAQIEASEIKQVPSAVKKEIYHYVTGVIRFEEQLISLLNIETLFEATDEKLFKTFSNIRPYLSFRLDLHETLDERDNQSIIKFLEASKISNNSATYQGALHFIKDYSKRNDKSIQESISILKTQLNDKDEIDYHPYLKSKKRVLFDHNPDFELFKNLVLHSIVPEKLRKNNYTLRVLNLANDIGEETVSLSIILNNFLQENDKWNIEVVYINIENSAPEIIIKNEYTQEELKKICSEEKQFFFDQNENLFSLKSEITKSINYPNIKYDQIKELGTFDLIFTRKIFFDFSNEEIFGILKLFKECLTNEGIIILSELEDITELDKEICTREFNKRRYFISVKGN